MDETSQNLLMIYGICCGLIFIVFIIAFIMDWMEKRGRKKDPLKWFLKELYQGQKDSKQHLKEFDSKNFINNEFKGIREQADELRKDLLEDLAWKKRWIKQVKIIIDKKKRIFKKFQTIELPLLHNPGEELRKDIQEILNWEDLIKTWWRSGRSLKRKIDTTRL